MFWGCFWVVGEELWDLVFLVYENVFGSVNELESNGFSAKIEVVHLYQPFGAKLEVFLAISQRGQGDVSMVAIGWL